MGILVLIMGPSGVGKGTIIGQIKQRHPDYVFPLSATTRPMRRGEKNGDVYHFWSKERFEEGIANDEFLEWAIVHKDYRYGTLKQPILEALEQGKVVIREIDVQGFFSIREKMDKNQFISVFISPPSFDTLRKHILKRGKMEQETLMKRFESAEKELQVAKECDYDVVNEEGNVAKAVEEVERIIKGRLL